MKTLIKKCLMMAYVFALFYLALTYSAKTNTPPMATSRDWGLQSQYIYTPVQHDPQIDYIETKTNVVNTPTPEPTPITTSIPSPTVVATPAPTTTPTPTPTQAPIAYDYEYSNRTATDFAQADKETVKLYITEVFGENAEDALIIAHYESGTRSNAASSGYYSTAHIGVFQISCKWHAQRVDGACANLFDYRTNTMIAKHIFDEQGWNPWSTKHNLPT